MAQINKGTFRKNIGKFSLKQAIQEVMSIQQQKADFRQISLVVRFDEIPENTEISTDMQRLQ